MQRRRFGATRLLGLMAGGIMLLAAGQAQAASGNGPYYAEPAWDQKLAPATRFVLLLDWNSDAVLDRETGLVWEKTPDPTPRSWAVARFQCASRTTGNRKGWRLPSVHELASLVDPANLNPSLPTGHPFIGVLGGTIQLDFYWSATTDVLNPAGSVWGVGFDDAVVGENPRNDVVRVWCVRGGGPLSEY